MEGAQRAPKFTDSFGTNRGFFFLDSGLVEYTAADFKIQTLQVNASAMEGWQKEDGNW